MRVVSALSPIVLLALLAVVPVARAEEGVLHLHGTPGADVRVDGRSLGKTPVVALRLSEGRHEIRLEKSGFETLTRTIWVGPVRGESRAYYLHEKRRRDAAWRAAVLPGWGTRYGDHAKRGALYTAAEAGALLYALYEDIRFRDRKSEYDDADRLYQEALTDAEIAEFRATRQSAYDRMDRSQTNRNNALLAAAAVYGVSLLDAVFLFPFGDDPEPEACALRPVLRTGRDGVRASLRLVF
ncbi:MAG: PEGA domain-containing protein [Candidatus Eisenbacteria bacterium]|nr:PEGA domain-containing protein [Candidatus Eisenbacteria bacterium]